MADIFNRRGSELKGTFSSDGARVVFSGKGDPQVGGVGLLTQNLNVNYQQQVTRLYEVGSDFTFLVAGRAQGQCSIGRILGPRPVQAEFYKQYGDVCNALNNNVNIELAAGCGTEGGAGGFNLSLTNLVITSIGFSIAAMDMIINEQVQALFVSMNLAAKTSAA